MIINQTTCKYLTIALAIILIALANYSAFGHEYHDAPHETITNVTNITNAAQGTALAIASGQHQFDYATPAWQASLSGSAYKNESAGSVALGKNFGGILVNGSISRTGNDNAYGLAGTWRFP